MVATTIRTANREAPHGLSREQLLELYYWMRLTRSLEERLVNLYRQTKVVGGLFRSLGQEACAVGSRLRPRRRGDVLSPLIRNLGSMLVQGATPVEVLRQYMAKGDSPTRGRELNIHFGDVEDRSFIGQISHLGDMVPVMAGVTLSFKMRKRAAGRAGVRRRRRDVDRRLSRGNQLRGRATLSAGRHRRKQWLRLLHADVRAAAAEQLVDKAAGYGIPGDAGGWQRCARRPMRPRARPWNAPGSGGGVTLDRGHDLPSEGSRRARQSVVCAGRRDRSLGARERPD